MRLIVANIFTLIQYLKLLSENLCELRPDSCPHCGFGNLWFHGRYERKPDRPHCSKSNLNPIPIFRFYCPNCKRTCSVLPECIPPRRWYLWTVQQAVLLLYLGKQSIRQLAKQTAPSRRTIHRWLSRFKERFIVHASHLKSLDSKLGYRNSFSEFWQGVLAKMPLSTAMRQLNYLNNIVP